MYNRSLLVYCKEIFYNKIPDNKPLMLEYLRLYKFIQLPVSSNFESYIDLVVDQLLLIFQKYTNIKVIVETVTILKLISPKHLTILIK
jgi:hypothetical protein